MKKIIQIFIVPTIVTLPAYSQQNPCRESATKSLIEEMFKDVFK